MVGGCPDRCDPRDAAERVARLALAIVAHTEQLEPFNGRKINIRVGVFSGPITAAVVGGHGQGRAGRCGGAAWAAYASGMPCFDTLKRARLHSPVQIGLKMPHMCLVGE